MVELIFGSTKIFGRGLGAFNCVEVLEDQTNRIDPLPNLFVSPLGADHPYGADLFVCPKNTEELLKYAY